jgi:GNAT superfamily N-acetyltransferase
MIAGKPRNDTLRADTGNIEVTEAKTLEDWHHLKELVHAYMVGENPEGGHLSDSDHHLLILLKKGTLPYHGKAILVKQNDIPVGCVLLDESETPELLTLRKLYIQPESRGKGLAKTLLHRAAVEALIVHAGTLSLDLEETRKDALLLCRQSGFSITSPISEDGYWTLMADPLIVKTRTSLHS